MSITCGVKGLIVISKHKDDLEFVSLKETSLPPLCLENDVFYLINK